MMECTRCLIASIAFPSILVGVGLGYFMCWYRQRRKG